MDNPERNNIAFYYSTAEDVVSQAFTIPGLSAVGFSCVHPLRKTVKIQYLSKFGQTHCVHNVKKTSHKIDNLLK